MSNPDSDAEITMDPTAARPLDLYPLVPMTEDDDPEVWCHHLRPPTGRPICMARMPLVVHLPGVQLLNCAGPLWACRPGEIRVCQGFQWDGASGPAINDDAALMGSLVHDIICTRITLAGHATHPLPSYWARHYLYARIIRIQGGAVWRVSADWIGLVAANWAVDLCQPTR